MRDGLPLGFGEDGLKGDRHVAEYVNREAEHIGGQLTKPHAANSKPITARIAPNTVNGHSINVKSMQEKSRSRTARFSNAEP